MSRCVALSCGASRRFSSSTVFVCLALVKMLMETETKAETLPALCRKCETLRHECTHTQADRHTHTHWYTEPHNKKMRARETRAKMRIRKCFCRPNSLIWIIYNWQTQQQTFNNNHNNSKIQMYNNNKSNLFNCWQLDGVGAINVLGFQLEPQQRQHTHTHRYAHTH